MQQESTTTFMTVYGNQILESTPVAKQIDRIGQEIERDNISKKKFVEFLMDESQIEFN